MSEKEHPHRKNVIVAGGGAAGFFAAINLAIKQPGYSVTILEKSNKLLSKVRISGGGRCNITHACFDRKELVKNYPRGEKELLQVFSRFDAQDTIQWFSSHGLSMHTEADGRMFPVSNNSESVIDCFMQLTHKYRVRIEINCEILNIEKETTGFQIKTTQGPKQADAIVCAIGGHPKSGFYDLLRRLGHQILEPIPSLFTFNLPGENICKQLQGLSVAQAEIRLGNSKRKQTGPLLITHWGLSGPVVLKLSAFAAKELADMNYHTVIFVNWLYPLTLAEVEAGLKEAKKQKHKALPHNHCPFDLPKRLWDYLCKKAGLSDLKPWAEVSAREISGLTQVLCATEFRVQGKTTFKEEFVTCGGVDLKEVDLKTMQSKKVPGLFFCGEVLNIDGITGGFNFQSAWSSAWIVSENC